MKLNIPIIKGLIVVAGVAALFSILHFNKIRSNKEEQAYQEAVALKVRAEQILRAKRKRLTIEELKHRLNLTDKQVERLRPIMKTQSTKRKEILTKYSAVGEQGKEAILKELELFMKYYDNMYMHILTEEQFRKYMQIRSELHQE